MIREPSTSLSFTLKKNLRQESMIMIMGHSHTSSGKCNNDVYDHSYVVVVDDDVGSLMTLLILLTDTSIQC